MNIKPSAPSIAGTKQPAGAGSTEKNKWQIDFLLERLRLSQQNKSFQDLSKSVRMSLLEKRYAMDAIEKANLQKTLDNLQNYIQVKCVSRSWLIERLESLSRHLGLKFNIDSQNILFISSDMFYIEICLSPNDTVKHVNVHHEGASQPQSCKELVVAIQTGNFKDLTDQLEGLISIYQINAEKSIKCKAFVALQALEADLSLLSMNFSVKDHSPLGLVCARRCGHPMQITYFVSAYDMIDVEKKQLNPQITQELVNTKKIGCSVTVNLEASAATRLQVQPLFVMKTELDGRTSPVYEPMGAGNSMLLPATFVLKLNKATPICVKLVEMIEKITEQKINCNKTAIPIMDLIAYSESGSVQNLEKGLYVFLPEQSHCYYLTESNMPGYMVNSIPFSDPKHVPNIINFLRQQALFNTLIGSCVRSGSKQDVECNQTFEVSALSHQYISIILEHPYQQQLTTIEFDLSDSSNISCAIYCGSTASNIAGKIGQVMQTCMSIPVTMRYLMKVWDQEHARINIKKSENENFSLPLGSNDPGGEEEFDPLAPSSNEGRNGSDYGSRGYSNGGSDRMEDKTAVKKEAFDTFFSTAEDEIMFDESNSCDSFSMGGDSSQDVKVELNSAVSITPISASPSHSGIRTGIEIIPLSSATNAKDLPASITITPINSSKEKKSSSTKRVSSGEKSEKSEKKKKRKREESPMGPPDPLNKPVSVSLHCLSSSSKASPKHSPGHSASPKHITSPKHGISSPKHLSGGGLVASTGGKPSMSALKSAATSPKACPTPPHTSSALVLMNNTNSSSSSSSTSCPSLVNSVASTDMAAVAGSDKSSPSQVKNRSKGSLTAVIDKLAGVAAKTTAQVPDDVFSFAPSPQNNNNNNSSTSSSSTTTINPSSINHSTNASSLASGINSIAPQSSSSSNISSNKSSEYMVKHSSDGMKITINKTKSKEKLSSSGSTLTKIFSAFKLGAQKVLSSLK